MMMSGRSLSICGHFGQDRNNLHRMGIGPIGYSWRVVDSVKLARSQSGQGTRPRRCLGAGGQLLAAPQPTRVTLWSRVKAGFWPFAHRGISLFMSQVSADSPGRTELLQPCTPPTSPTGLEDQTTIGRWLMNLQVGATLMTPGVT